MEGQSRLESIRNIRKTSDTGETVTVTAEAPPREPRCRMRNRLDNPCPNPALDPEAEVLICVKHAARVMRLVAEQRAAARTATRRTQ